MQAGADDAHLGDRGVGRHLPGTEVADDARERLLRLAELALGNREREVRLAPVTHVLDDHVDIDAGLGEGVEQAPGDARPIRHRDDRDLGDVPIVGQATDLVPLLHEWVLLDQRSGGVLERAEDLDDDIVHPAQLDRPGLHHLGALVGQLEHFLVADDGQLAGVGHESRVRGVDAADVGEDLASRRAEAGGEGDGGRVAAAAAEGRDVTRRCVRRASAGVIRTGGPTLEPGHDDDLALLELGLDASGLDARDPGPAVPAVRRDPGLRSAQADRGHAQGVECHRQEGRALVLAGCEQHVELALIGRIGDGRGQAEELVGGVAHRRDDDHEARPGRALTGDAPRDPPDPICVGEAGASEFLDDERLLDDERRGRHRDILPPGLRPPGSRKGCEPGSRDRGREWRGRLGHRSRTPSRGSARIHTS